MMVEAEHVRTAHEIVIDMMQMTAERLRRGLLKDAEIRKEGVGVFIVVLCRS